MLLTLLNILVPVFAIAGLGYLFARRQSSAPNMDFINRVNVNLFCPALIFSALAANPVDVSSAWVLVVAGVGIVVVPGLLLALVRPAGISQPAFLMTGMFRNTGNMGIPLMLLAFGREQLGDIIVLFVLANTLHFSLGLFLLSREQGYWRWLRNPNVWAAILGIGLAPIHAQIPAFVDSTLDMLGQVAIPLMLFSLGVRLAHGRITQWGMALKINALYLSVGALSVLLVVWWLPLTQEWIRLLVVTACLPPAVLNYLLSEQYQKSPAAVANVVLVGNLLSVITMPIVMGLTLAWL